MISYKKTEIQNKVERRKSTHGLEIRNPKKIIKVTILWTLLLTGSSTRSESGNQGRAVINICCLLRPVLSAGTPWRHCSERARTHTALWPQRTGWRAAAALQGPDKATGGRAVTQTACVQTPALALIWACGSFTSLCLSSLKPSQSLSPRALESEVS